jgi:hypothetical protein
VRQSGSVDRVARVKGVLYSLLATVVGLAMVGGGIWGLVADDGGGSGGETKSQVIPTETVVPANSAPEECAQVAERDPRFRRPHVLQFGADGHGTVQCRGQTVNFTILLEGLPSGFYDVVLEKGRREEQIGSALAVGDQTVLTGSAGEEVDLRRYDFVTVRESDFAKGTAAERGPDELATFRGAL